MSIKLIKVRASVVFGSVTVKTPFVLSFNVMKVRNKICTFSASLKVEKNSLGSSNSGMVKISAGEDHPKIIFTGILRHMSVAPCWDDPGYVVVNISGEDATSLLRGKSFSRRARGTKSVWATIDSVNRTGLRDGKWAYETGTVTLSPDAIVSENKQGTTRSPVADKGATLPFGSANASIITSFSYNAELTKEVNDDDS